MVREEQPMVTIQIDEQTAKTLENAARVAGLTLTEYIRTLAEVESKPVVQAAWDKLEREFEELSVDGALPRDFSRADIYVDHD
jgi:hypothetical protein